jgi:hypothetical protein
MQLVGEVGHMGGVTDRGRDELGVRLNLLIHIYHWAAARCRTRFQCTPCRARVS